MSRYQHSVSFSLLKRIRETIPENYTSFQYAEVLDTLLYTSIEPLIFHTNVCSIWMPRILAWYSNVSNSRKISSLDRETLQTKLCLFMLIPPAERLDLLKRMKLERNLVTLIIDDFLELTKEYRALEERACMASKTDRPILLEMMRQQQVKVGVNGADLYPLYQHVKVWYELYLEFRSYLIEKFTRYAITKARENYVKVNFALKLDDIIQHYMLALGKAIDKNDTEEGPLASYVGQWFLNARNTVKKEIGNLQTESYDELAENEFDFGIHQDVEQHVERMQTIERVRHFAQVADPLGLGRLRLEIEEPTIEN